MSLTPKRIAGVVVGGLLIAVALYTLFFLEPDESVPVKVPVVRPARIYVVPAAGTTEVRTFPGFVQGAERVPLSFRVGGALIEFPARENLPIDGGAVIARLDPRDFESEVSRIAGQIDEASAVLTAMKKGERDEVIRMLEAKVNAADASFEAAATEFGRQQRLYEKGLISKSQLDRYKLEVDIARETLAGSKEDLIAAKSGARPEEIDAQQARISALEAQQRSAEAALADTVLKAPFNGLVTKRHVENYEEVRTGQTVVTLQAVDRLEVVADIPESLIARVRRASVEKAVVTFDFNPGVEYPAEYVEMTAQADARTSTYRLTVRLDAPDDVRVLPGMTASLAIHLNHSQEEGLAGFLVPVNAVFSDPSGGAPKVWIVDPSTNRVRRAAVQVGEILDGKIAVKEGVKQGDVIVTAGVHLLEPDQEVRPLEQKSN